MQVSAVLLDSLKLIFTNFRALLTGYMFPVSLQDTLPELLKKLGYSFARKQTAKFGFCFFQPLTQPPNGLRPFKRNNSRNMSALVRAF